jgi:hypothetical protein
MDIHLDHCVIAVSELDVSNPLQRSAKSPRRTRAGRSPAVELVAIQERERR